MTEQLTLWLLVCEYLCYNSDVSSFISRFFLTTWDFGLTTEDLLIPGPTWSPPGPSEKIKNEKKKA